ncbi:MAG TPA: DUF1616 domain-containing protein [Thermoplasmata archaeon]|nr:DUF1616 domain-containing protein [Thermoplasmata archaeon]
MADALTETLLGILGVLRVLGAILLTFVIPGLLLVNVLYPRQGELDREYDILYRLTLGIVLSIAVTVLWGFFLNSLGVQESTGLGYVQTPYIAAGLIGLSVLFFALGWWRGAYPWMARLRPSLARTPKAGPEALLTEDEKDHRIRLKLQALAEERERLRRAIKEAERRMQLHSTDARSHYEAQRDEAKADLKRVESELRKLEEERATELYG